MSAKGSCERPRDSALPDSKLRARGMTATQAQRRPLTSPDRLRLLLKFGFQSDDLDVYGFNSGRPLRDAERYLGYDWYRHRVRPVVNAQWAKPLTENKWVFSRLLDSFGVPAPITLGLFDPIHGVTRDGQRPLRTSTQVFDELDERRPRGLVLKPVGGTQGKQLLILDAIDYSTRRAVTREGAEMSLEAALGRVDLAGMRGYSGYILQEPLAVHEVFERLAPWTTNTVRIQTILGSDGVVRVQAAVARLGRRGNMADNWEQGGLCVAIDAATGVMGRGVVKVRHGGDWYSSHPDTGEPFAGVQVPFWDDALQLCRRSARLIPGLRSLGWDVVIAPDGPVLLEANADWDLQLIQVHTDGFLADPEFRAQLLDLGVPLPDNRMRALPRSAIARARRRIARTTSRRAGAI